MDKLVKVIDNLIISIKQVKNDINGNLRYTITVYENDNDNEFIKVTYFYKDKINKGRYNRKNDTITITSNYIKDTLKEIIEKLK